MVRCHETSFKYAPIHRKFHVDGMGNPNQDTMAEICEGEYTPMPPVSDINSFNNNLFEPLGTDSLVNPSGDAVAQTPFYNSYCFYTPNDGTYLVNNYFMDCAENTCLRCGYPKDTLFKLWSKKDSFVNNDCGVCSLNTELYGPEIDWEYSTLQKSE
jgi:hypothetical protein